MVKPPQINLEALFADGLACHQAGRFAEAERCYRQVLQNHPKHAAVSHHLGILACQAGALQSALQYLKKAHEVEKENTDYCAAYAGALLDCGEENAALHVIEKALKQGMDAPVLLQMWEHIESPRLNVLLAEEKLAALERRSLTLLKHHSGAGFAWMMLGVSLVLQGRDGIAALQKAVEAMPDHAGALSNLGNALSDKGRFSEAIACYRRALEIQPEFAEGHNNLGNLLQDMGDLEGAQASYRRALAENPAYSDAHSNLLFLRNYHPNLPAPALLAEALSYGARVGRCAKRYEAWGVGRDVEKRLRIGLVSGDFCAHPVGYFIEGVLKALKGGFSERLELYAYANQHTQDAVTQRIRSQCDAWKEIAGLSDARLAETIWQDHIDLLIDLSGHTAYNRLPVFAWKPAPVQVSWLGYFATTGVKEIDYLLADPWTVPEGAETAFSEQIWRLPETRLCFTAPPGAIDPGPLPALESGRLTLGCFNNLTKMNDDVVRLWSRVLHALPESRLFLKARQLNEARMVTRVEESFAAHGIAPAQLLLEGRSPRKAYLEAYRRVDIGLDPFPFTGGTTTAESLWMGVPVLTLQGNNLVGRQGVGLLMNAGLSDWIAQNEDDYVDKAIAHAADWQKLAALRAGLRAQVLASPVFDAPRFARHLEEALRGMWRQWAASKA